jgi:hypothetical protein
MANLVYTMGVVPCVTRSNFVLHHRRDDLNTPQKCHGFCIIELGCMESSPSGFKDNRPRTVGVSLVRLARGICRFASSDRLHSSAIATAHIRVPSFLLVTLDLLMVTVD